VTKNNLLSVLKAIGGLSTDGILLFSLRRKALDFVNDGLLKIFDISHESFRHQPEFFINHIVPEDIEYLKGEYEKLLREKKAEEVEFLVKAHEGSIKNVSCSCYLLEDGKYIVGIFKDITNIREHENYIINYGAKKNALLEMVTHNLSGPLTLSRNMLESLEDTLKERGIDINGHVQLIKENTTHCIDIVTDFLEEEHFVSEHIFVKKNRWDMLEKLNTIVERYRKSFPDLKFHITKNADTILISNDDVKFLQVANNLISNAVKWSPSGSVIEIIVDDTHDQVAVAVKDQGVGIPDNLKNKLFQKNTPAARPGLKGEKSIGMGLYIVKKLVALMDGSVSVESRENQGTTVTITLQKEEATASK
jgi:two-component system sensor histidine kinase VicK